MITIRCLLVVVASSVALGSCALNSSDDEAMTVTAVFDNAVGIYETGDVLVLDQPVGEIRSIELFADRVEVEFTVRADVPLPGDVNAAIEAQSVLGERSIVLFPPWSEASAAAGAERLRDGASIPATRTQVPVEPDEALQSVNELLSSLEPDVVGGLIGDSAQILDGRGERIGSAIDSAADLTDTLVAVDQPMLEAARSFNQVASTLTTRDVQLRTLIRDFGAAVDVLAAERADLQRFLGSLNDLTAETSDLLDRHAEQIPGMLATLAATLEVVEVNADSIPVLASNLPVVAESFEAAYKEELGGFFLKVNTSAVLETVIEQLLDAVGLFPGEI